ncbi:MAG TPA: gas vesicle protein [Myxococcales bacterium]|nr:gas vesicle protein [Myxococcales bacterium]
MKKRARSEADEIIDRADASLLEIIDHVLNKGVMLQGEVILGVAGVDLVYLRLNALLCAADRLLPRRGGS